MRYLSIVLLLLFTGPLIAAEPEPQPATPPDARELVRVFTGDDRGAHRDALLMGTSLVLECEGMASDPLDGVARAAAAIDGGDAEAFLGRYLIPFEIIP